MSPEMLEAVASLATFALALVGLPFLIIQLRHLQRSVESGAHAAIYSQGSDVRAHLVEHPHLRPYFFDGADIDPDDPEYPRVLSIAELFLNYLEHVAVLGDTLGAHNRASLDRFVRNSLARSPVLRRRLEEDPASYSHALQAYAAGSIPARPEGTAGDG